MPEQKNVEESMKLAFQARDLLLSNKIEEGRSVVERYRNTDMYAAMAYCNIGFMQAIMTFDRDRIAQSIIDIDKTLQLVNEHRHKDGVISYMMSYVKNRDFSKFTELELHAELLYAEVLLVRAVLTFAEDADSLVSFVKGAFKIKTSHSLYKEMYACLSLEEELIKKDPNHRVVYSRELESGIKTGWGAFCLGLSLLPPKVLRLLEFVGLEGNKEKGLQLSVHAEKMDTLRSFVVANGLLNYQTIALQFLKSEEYDDKVVTDILDRYLTKYPASVTFTFYKGRRQLINKDIEGALRYYEQCESSPIDWTQVYHLCYWERMWCYAMLLQWDKAAELAMRLFDDSKWSRTLFAYQYLAFKFMADMEHGSLEDMASKIPKFQLKIGGKHLHIEKFAIRKARSFLKNDKFLCLPGIELLYIWRYIPLISTQHKQQLVSSLETCLQDIDNIKPYYTKHPIDDWFLCHLLLAVVVAELGDSDHAQSLLRTALQSEDHVQVDHFYIPYAHYELGILYLKNKDFDQARAHMRYAKEFSGKVKSYSLENRLLFKIHSAMSAMPPKK